jgi:hypothetical protein
MSLISIIEVLTPITFVAAVIGFILCLVELVKAIRGNRKIPYGSILLLIVPMTFIFSTKYLVIGELERAISNEAVTVSIEPVIETDPKKLLSDILAGLYQNKGRSGSHPTEKEVTFTVCREDECFTTIAAQDSRDPDMHWIRYEAFTIKVPLGFTQLNEGKK